MTAKVTKKGLFVPKEYLPDVDEVEIRREHNTVVIIPIVFKDPILELGQHPVSANVDDASVSHDKYLYR